MLRTIITLARLAILIPCFSTSTAHAASQACLVEVKLPQMNVYDKSCFENFGVPAQIFYKLCSENRKLGANMGVTVKDMRTCPRGALAYCETRHPAVSGKFRTYTYNPNSVSSLKLSCLSKLPGMPQGRWVVLIQSNPAQSKKP